MELRAEAQVEGTRDNEVGTAATVETAVRAEGGGKSD